MPDVEPTDSPDRPQILPVPPPLIYVMGLGAGLTLQRLLRISGLPRRPRLIAGGALLTAGGLLMSAGARTMRKAETPIDPRQPVRTIVTDGPFRFSRNPLYLSLALVYGGVAVLMGAIWSLLLLPVTLAVVIRRVIEPEERYLEAKFGDEYRQYKARVRRFL